MDKEKYLLRAAYNSLRSRRLRVGIIRFLEMLKVPIYRIGLDTNNLCNLQCIMCYLHYYKAPKPQVMPIEVFESIAKQLFGKVKLLDLSCGFEPFMTRNFLAYARIARKYCRGKIGICTNALLMTEDDIRSIISEGLLDEINISCDGLTGETYNSIRKKGSFDRLIQVLEALRDTREGQGIKKPIIRLNYTMLRRNIEELDGAYAFVKKYGVDILQLRHAKLTGEFSELFEESLFYHQDLSDACINKVKTQFADDRSVQLISPPLFSGGIKSVADKSACAYPWFNFVISSNADVRMCNLGIIGNLQKEAFADIKASQPVRKMHQQLLGGAYEDLCRDCYSISDMENVGMKSTFIRDDIMAEGVESEVFVRRVPVA